MLSTLKELQYIEYTEYVSFCELGVKMIYTWMTYIHPNQLKLTAYFWGKLFYIIPLLYISQTLPTGCKLLEYKVDQLRALH